MRGQRSARKLGSASGAAKCCAAMAMQARARFGGRRAVDEGFAVRLQRRVPKVADLARSDHWADRRERLQLEDPLGEDRVGVATQGLDAGDAEAVRPQRQRRLRFGAAARPIGGGAVERLGEREIARAARLGGGVCGLAGDGGDALEKARSDGRRAAALARAADDRFARAERGDEIVRGLADAPFRRRQAERGAHRAVEEGVGLGGRRPDGLVEPGDEREVEGEQPRFEQAEDLQARVGSARRRRALGRQHRVEQRRVIGERAAEAGVDLRRPVFEQRLQRFAAARVAPIAILGRQRGESGAMSGDEVGERRVGPKRAQAARAPRRRRRAALRRRSSRLP